jgi:hypothetical protein
MLSSKDFPKPDFFIISIPEIRPNGKTPEIKKKKPHENKA